MAPASSRGIALDLGGLLPGSPPRVELGAAAAPFSYKEEEEEEDRMDDEDGGWVGSLMMGGKGVGGRSLSTSSSTSKGGGGGEIEIEQGSPSRALLLSTPPISSSHEVKSGSTSLNTPSPALSRTSSLRGVKWGGKQNTPPSASTPSTSTPYMLSPAPPIPHNPTNSASSIQEGRTTTSPSPSPSRRTPSSSNRANPPPPLDFLLSTVSAAPPPPSSLHHLAQPPPPPSSSNGNTSTRNRRSSSSSSFSNSSSEEVDIEISLLPSFPRPPSGSQPSSPRPFSPSTPPPIHLLALVPATPEEPSFDLFPADIKTTSLPPSSDPRRAPSPVASITPQKNDSSSTYSSNSSSHHSQASSSTSSLLAEEEEADVSASPSASASSESSTPSRQGNLPPPSTSSLPTTTNSTDSSSSSTTPIPSTSTFNLHVSSSSIDMSDPRRPPSSWETSSSLSTNNPRKSSSRSDGSDSESLGRQGVKGRARGMSGTFGRGPASTTATSEGGSPMLGGGEFESEKRDAFDQRALGGLRLNGRRDRRDEEFGGGDDQGSVGSYEEEDQKSTHTRFPSPPDPRSRRPHQDPPALPPGPPPPSLPPNQPSASSSSMRSHSTDPHSTLSANRSTSNSRTNRPSTGSSYSGGSAPSSSAGGYAPSSRTSMVSSSTRGERERERGDLGNGGGGGGAHASRSSSFFSATSASSNGSSSYNNNNNGNGISSPHTSPYSPQSGFPRSTSLSTINSSSSQQQQQYQQKQQQQEYSSSRHPPPSSISSNGSRSRERKESQAAPAPHPFAAALPPAPLLSQHNHGNYEQQRRQQAPAAMAAPPLALIVSSDSDEDETYKCPVCVERMGSDYRIQGEKPDVIPECGHAIHHDCFVHVYGPLPEANKYGVVRKPQSFGVCGVCRKPMKVGEDGGAGNGGGGKSSKLAALTGVKGMNAPPQPVLNPNQKHKSNNSYGSDDDDPLTELTSGGASTRSGTSDHVSRYEATNNQIVVPSVVIRPEFSSMVRTGGKDGKLTLTAVIVVEIPERLKREEHVMDSSSSSMMGGGGGGGSASRMMNRGAPLSSAGRPRLEPPLPITPRPTDSSQGSSVSHPSPDELRRRLLFSDGDLGSSSLDNLSTLLACDRALVRSSPSATSLSAKKEGKDRDYLLYLFKEALLCIQESGSTSSSSSSNSKLRSKTSSLFKRKPSNNSLGSESSQSNERVLKLKGKVFVHHMKGVMDGLKSSSASASSHPASLSITIIMNDRDTDDFIVGFADRATKERWWDRITHLIPVLGRDGLPSPSSNPTPSFKKSPSQLLSPSSMMSSGSERSSSAMGHNRDQFGGGGPGRSSRYVPSESSPTFGSASPHTPIDLLLILSLSSPSTSSSATALRTRVIRSSLAFIMSTLGPRDRLSVVTYENGPGGVIRKTPFLAVGREGRGKWKMQEMLETIGEQQVVQHPEDSDDESGAGGGFVVPLHRDEKADVVSAVNVALDVVLQRKTRNPLTGITLVSDTTDSVIRGQMDLVLARAEAASVPIHSIGYGKSHDPTPLWLISNHTNGTYTFVPDWYNLQDSLAGVVGGMMSIAITKMKLHLSTQDNDFRIRKVAGAPHAIVSPDQKHVDIELREVRHGERKEMLIELELSVPYVEPSPSASRERISDDFGRGGLAPNGNPNGTLSRSSSGGGPTDSNQLGESMYANSSMIEEVPVIELDFSFHDPSCTKSCTRLARPILLLLTLTPPTNEPPSSSPPTSDATITRRRMELLASDIITRALGLFSKGSQSSAQRILGETRMIIQGVANGLIDSLGASSNPYSNSASAKKEKRDAATRETLTTLDAILADVDVLIDGLDEDSRATFERDQRNFGSQQAMVLRSQKSWTARTDTERLFFTCPEAIELVAKSISAPRD
ncbi:hypothetical protein BDY24DRAFT_414377 [Mrakia frigida]|uniref:uncharacterized protein n=1 Tax=Mrakia frigida TaxID=29902 RepID=UPI003FCBFBA3